MRAMVTSLAVLAVLACGPTIAAAGTPSETFLALYDAVLKAKAADDIAPLVKKADRDQLKTVPAEAKEMFLDMHKEWVKTCHERPKVTKETIEGDKATLEAEVVSVYAQTGSPWKATVTLVKEADGWKVAEHPRWKYQRRQ